MPLYIGGASTFVERRYLDTGYWTPRLAWRTRIMRVSPKSFTYVSHSFWEINLVLKHALRRN